MKTITGIFKDSSGVARYGLISFKPTSVNVFSGLVIGTIPIVIKSSAADGTFSVSLEAGNYTVEFSISGNVVDLIAITVPDGTGEISIESVTTTPTPFVFTPPNTVWNAHRKGNLYFDIVSRPPVPTSSNVTYAGSSLDASTTFHYAVSYVTTEGETNISTDLAVTTPSPFVDKAVRLAVVVPSDALVTSKRIWRKIGATYRLFAEISPSVTIYDDFESVAVFTARADVGIDALTTNNSTGGLYYNGVLVGRIGENGFENPDGSSISAPAEHSGVVSLANGIDTKTVTGLGLSFTPTKIFCSILRPVAGLILFASPLDSLTSDGFTVDLTGMTDNTNYKLCYTLKE